MTSKNKLLSKSSIVEQEQEQEQSNIEIETPLDLLPDVAYPTWMKHEILDPILANSKKEYYDATAKGYVQTDKCVNN